MGDPETLRILVVAAGVSQLVLIVASLAIPRVLGWRAQLAVLRPMTRQVFWSYAAYIWATNLAFGLVSTFGADLLVDRSPLSACVTGFIAVYWLARVGIQVFYFDRADLPQRRSVLLAEWALIALFVILTAIYVQVTVVNMGGDP